MEFFTARKLLGFILLSLEFMQSLRMAVPPSSRDDAALQGTRVRQKFSAACASTTTFEKYHFLPIIPNIVGDSQPLDDFFANYPKEAGGWVDVNKLSLDDISKLRSAAQGMFDRELQCGYPRVSESLAVMGKDHDPSLQYCFWTNDYITDRAMKDFEFERYLWTWVGQQFNKLPESVLQNKDECTRLGYLDIGINVADWIAPMRLINPDMAIYGVEGSPAVAALALANMRTSMEHNLLDGRHAKDKRLLPPTKILPFSLTTKASLESTRRQGGVCFMPSDTENVGGRQVTPELNCSQSMVAGATTLEHAIQALTCSACSSHSGANREFPSIYIMKIDIEGFEFKALSSVVRWLNELPPCYLIFEWWDYMPQHHAMIELFQDLGYDRAWLPRNGNFPGDTPWWAKETHGKLETIIKGAGKYNEIIVGFPDQEACLANLQA